MVVKAMERVMVTVRMGATEVCKGRGDCAADGAVLMVVALWAYVQQGEDASTIEVTHSDRSCDTVGPGRRLALE